MKRFAWSVNDGDKPRPVTGQKRKLAHGLALRVDTARNGLRCEEQGRERNHECCWEQRCGEKGRKTEHGNRGFHRRTPWRRNRNTSETTPRIFRVLYFIEYIKHLLLRVIHRHEGQRAEAGFQRKHCHGQGCASSWGRTGW